MAEKWFAAAKKHAAAEFHGLNTDHPIVSHNVTVSGDDPWHLMTVCQWQGYWDAATDAYGDAFEKAVVELMKQEFGPRKAH